MKRRFPIVWCVAAIILSFKPPVAAWAGFQSLGGIIVDNPSCATADDGTGEVICAAKGTDNSLFGIRFFPTLGVTGFQSLGGVIVGDPSCAAAGDRKGQVTCVAKGTDNSLFGIRFDPGFSSASSFSTGFQSLGGVIVGDPSCATDNEGTGRVICVAKGTDNLLFGIELDPATSFSTGFESLDLGGRFVGNPSCASPDLIRTGDVICAAKGTDNSLFGIRFFPTLGVTGFQSLGGVIVGNPSCASAQDATGQVICAAKGTDNSLFGIEFDPATSFSTGFQSLGGVIVDNPSCASLAITLTSGDVICAAKGTDNSLFGTRF